MAIPTSIAGMGALFGGAVPISPSLALLLLFTGIVAAMIYAYQPPFPQTMVFAFVPWIVTGLFLHVMASTGLYPSYLVPLFTKPGAYLITIFLPGLVWMTLLNVSTSRRGLPAYHHYVGTMGIGAMGILFTALIFHLGASYLSRMLVLLLVPLISLLATGVIALSIGLWSPDFMEYTSITGSFVIFGAFMNGIATTTNVVVNGKSAHTPFSAVVRDVAAVAIRQGWIGVGMTHLWVWLFLVGSVAIGIHVATTLAPYAGEKPRTVHVMLGLVGAVGFTLGFDHLLAMVVG